MADVEVVKIESDERGFELHLIVGDDIEHHDDGLVILNIHGVAVELMHECVRKIGPWYQEMLAAEREYRTGIADDPILQPVLDRIKGRGGELDGEDEHDER